MINNENENENDQKDEKINDIIKKSLNINEDKYLLKIYISKDNATIIFKVEQENIQTFYFYEKFDLRDFQQKNKQFNSNQNIQEAFNSLKQIIVKNSTKLNKKQSKIIITFSNKSETVATFSLRKKIVSQNRLNPLLVNQIQENKSIINELKNESKKLDKTVNNQNDIINNINNKIDIINNNIKKIINDINNINFTIKNSINKEENGLNIIPKVKEENIKSNTNRNRRENKNINKNGHMNNNRNVKEEKKVKEEEKGENEKREKLIDYKNELRKIEKKNYILLFFDIILLFFFLKLNFYCNRINNDLNKEILDEKNSIKKYTFFDYLSHKDLDYIESYMKNKDKENNFYLRNSNNKPINENNNNIGHVVNHFKDKIKKADNIEKPLIEIKNDNRQNYQNNNETNKNKINEIKNTNNNSNSNIINQDNISINKNQNIDKIKVKTKDEKFILQNEEEKYFFKNKIKQKANYKIKDINFVLKYKSDDSEYKDFYNNCKGISQNLILIKNKEGKKVGIFAKNIIDILHNIKTKNLLADINNFIGYIFGPENIDEIYFQDFFDVYNVFISIFKDIFNFLDKEMHLNQGNIINNMDLEDNPKYFGDIEKIEIYQVKYIIK